MKTPSGIHWFARWTLWFPVTVAALVSACNLNNPGVNPPEGEFAFPVALALSQTTNDAGAPTHLYVVNSNFDLAFNSGSVFALDLDAVEEAMEHPPLNGGSGADAGASPKSCQELSLTSGELPGDAGVRDAGAVDAGALDAGAFDGGALDAGVLDAGALDGGALDAAVSDASTEDAGETEMDAAAADGGVVDAGPLQPTPLPDDVGKPTEFGSQGGILCNGTDEDRQLPCCFSSREQVVQRFLSSQVIVDSYGSGIAVSPNGERLYVPLRSRNRLIFLDVEGGGAVTCAGNEQNCTRGPGPNSKDELPDQRLEPQPTAVVSGRLNDLGITGDRGEQIFVATAHEEGSLALFVEQGGEPVLEDQIQVGADRATSVSLGHPQGEDAGIPETNLLYVTSSLTPDIVRVELVLEPSGVAGESGPASSLATTSRITVPNLSQPVDLRDLVVDPRDPTRIAVLIGGVLNAVSFIQLDDQSPAEARQDDAVIVGVGPAKMVRGTFGGRQFLFVSSYNAQQVFILDEDLHTVVAVIFGFAGPFDMAVDEVRQLLYVGDFEASVIRVVDVSSLADRNQPPPRIIATIGALRFAQGLN